MLAGIFVWMQHKGCLIKWLKWLLLNTCKTFVTYLAHLSSQLSGNVNKMFPSCLLELKIRRKNTQSPLICQLKSHCTASAIAGTTVGWSKWIQLHFCFPPHHLQMFLKALLLLMENQVQIFSFIIICFISYFLFHSICLPLFSPGTRDICMTMGSFLLKSSSVPAANSPPVFFCLWHLNYLPCN